MYFIFDIYWDWSIRVVGDGGAHVVNWSIRIVGDGGAHVVNWEEVLSYAKRGHNEVRMGLFLSYAKRGHNESASEGIGR